MIALSYDKADLFVEQLQQRGTNVVWNGWDMVFLNPDPRAERSPYGVRQNGVWGYTTTVSPDSRGVWSVGFNLTRGDVSVRR